MAKLSNHAARPVKTSFCAGADAPRPPDAPRLFQRGSPPTTTGKLLLEVARFAAENLAFTEQGDRKAADRARDHLIHIRELANRRLAELPAPQNNSGEDAL